VGGGQERDPCYSHSLFNLGQHYERKGEQAEALALYQKGVQCSSADSRAQESAGGVLYAAGRTEEV
jgi:hypothetical protein